MRELQIRYVGGNRDGIERRGARPGPCHGLGDWLLRGYTSLYVRPGRQHTRGAGPPGILEKAQSLRASLPAWLSLLVRADLLGKLEIDFSLQQPRYDARLLTGLRAPTSWARRPMLDACLGGLAGSVTGFWRGLQGSTLIYSPPIACGSWSAWSRKLSQAGGVLQAVE
jgi:hypothetical protein